MNPVADLAEDRRLSPRTGHTRAHWQATADALPADAWRWASPRGARPDLPGPAPGSGVRGDGLEGCARTALTAAYRVAGAGGDDPHGLLARYAAGLDAGTRTPGADDAESWPVIGDHHVRGQPMVEAASVAPAPRVSRPWLWDRLDEAVRRFAAGAAVALGAVTGHTPPAPGVSRRLLSGCLRYFLDRGAVDERGLLSLGRHGPYAPVVQRYSGPAWPYWASKAFPCLLAPHDDPLRTDVERDAPVEERDRALGLSAPGFLVRTTVADGIARLHNHGSDHLRPHQAELAEDDDPHYGRFAYSTRTGPTPVGNPADNHFAAVFRGLRGTRRRVHPLGAGHGDSWGWAASWQRPVFPGGSPVLPALRVEGVVVARGRYELRVHRVVGAPPGAGVELTGWAVGPDEDLRSDLHPLYGWNSADEATAPGGTAFTPSARVPGLRGTTTGTSGHAALAVLTTGPGAPDLLGAVSRVDAGRDAVECAGRTVR